MHLSTHTSAGDGTFDNDLVEQVVDNFVTKAEDIFEIPFTGAAGDYEYGPFRVFGSQLQRLKQRLCRCSDGDERSFCVLYNTSLSVRVPWKRAGFTPDTTKAINGTFRVDYQNTVLMIRFSVMDGAGNRVCITNVKIPFSEMKTAYAEDVSLASELSAIDRNEYAQVAVEADNALHLWLDEHIHVLGENTCFSLPIAEKMVTPLITVLMLVGIGLASAVPSPHMPTVGCDFSGLDLDAMVNDIIEKLPSEYSTKGSKPGEVVSGLFLGPITFRGMDKLRPFGAVVGYCRNGTSLVQVDLATMSGMLEAVMPWKTCGGQKGTIETYTGARATIIFENKSTHKHSQAEAFIVLWLHCVAWLIPCRSSTPVTRENPSGAGPKLVYHSGPIPIYMDDVYVSLNGAGEFLRTTVAVLSKLFPQLPKEFWMDAIGDKLRRALEEASRKP
ncbi:hypothetical protein HPB50_021451 [Hyalomma asiaticum]|uniref:Uncharacterized protein n=1 Tax=Hyalomma asiaticum TaxID=266040 RepID=A0ACB7RY53_HYAAI|nr:hypothetical protein HPB50_021451 [Hyalomma asiaticum]